MALLNGTESIEQVEQVICDFFGVNIEDVYGRNKKSAVALARHFLIYILNTHYSYSYKQLMSRYNRCFRSISRSMNIMRYYTVHDKQYSGYYLLIFGVPTISHFTKS